MRLLLVVGCVCIVGTVAAQSPQPSSSTAIYLPLLAHQAPLPRSAPLPPELLGEALPIAGATAFFADQITSADGDLAIWIPPGVEVVRGIFLQHGAPIRPNPADPEWRNAVAQRRELAARQLASAWGFAYVSGNIWTESRRQYSVQRPYWEATLAEFAARTERPELLHAPLVIMGGSRFAGFGNAYAREFPERVIAYVMIVAGSGGVAPGVPGLLVVGERDRGAEIVAGSFRQDRSAGGLLAIAMVWRKGHVCDRCGDLVWPFLDTMVRLRLPADADPRTGPPQLVTLDAAAGYLGDTSSWATISPANVFAGDPGTTAWLPTAALAQSWLGFMRTAPVGQIINPTEPYSWSNGFTQEPAPIRKSQMQPIRADQPFTIEVSMNREPIGELLIAVNDHLVGPLAYDPARKRYIAETNLAAGVYSMVLLEDGNPISWPAGLVVVR